MASSDPQKNISKPGNDSEEEEEDYVPAPRPHRYVYKYHRVGSQSLDKVVTPAVSIQQHEVSHSSSSSSSYARSTTIASSQQESVSISSSQTMTCEGATSIGEIEASKILATHASQEQQPAPEEGKTMQLLESAPSTTESNVLTTPGEDTSANVSPPGQTQEGISGVTAEKVAIVSGVASGESQKDESSAQSTTQVIVGLTEMGETIVNGIILDSISTAVQFTQQPSEAAPPVETAPPTTETTSEIPDSVKEPLEATENAVQEGEKATQLSEVIVGVTADNVKILSNLSVETTTTQSVAESPNIASEQPSEASAPVKPDDSMKEVIGGLTSTNQAIISGLSTAKPTAPICQEPLERTPEMLSEPFVCTTQIVSGITSNGVAMVSGLALSQAPVIGSAAGLSTAEPTARIYQEPLERTPEMHSEPLVCATQIVSGITSNGVAMVSGLALSQAPVIGSAAGLSTAKPTAPIYQEPLERTPEMHSEPLVCATQIVSGLTTDGVAMVSGLALNSAPVMRSAAFDENIAVDVAQQPVKPLIFAGLTSDGTGIISGMTTEHNSEFADGLNDEFTSVDHPTDAIDPTSKLPDSLTSIVMGVTASGEQLLGGFTIDKQAEVISDAANTQLSTNIEIALGKAAEVSHALTANGTGQPQASGDGLAINGHDHLDPFGLLPTGVPTRSDSF